MCNGIEVPKSLVANSQFCVPIPHFLPGANHRLKVHVYWTRPGRQNEQHVAEAPHQIKSSPPVSRSGRSAASTTSSDRRAIFLELQLRSFAGSRDIIVSSSTPGAGAARCKLRTAQAKQDGRGSTVVGVSDKSKLLSCSGSAGQGRSRSGPIFEQTTSSDWLPALRGGSSLRHLELH